MSELLGMLANLGAIAAGCVVWCLGADLARARRRRR